MTNDKIYTDKPNSKAITLRDEMCCNKVKRFIPKNFFFLCITVSLLQRSISSVINWPAYGHTILMSNCSLEKDFSVFCNVNRSLSDKH